VWTVQEPGSIWEPKGLKTFLWSCETKSSETHTSCAWQSLEPRNTGIIQIL
jgi:hypothetical protein